jgi:hypothetical protein
MYCRLCVSRLAYRKIADSNHFISGTTNFLGSNLKIHAAKYHTKDKGSVAEWAERQPSSGVTGVQSLPAAPSRCGCVTLVRNSLVGY